MSDCSSTFMRNAAMPVSMSYPDACAFIRQLQRPVPRPSIPDEGAGRSWP